MLVLEVLMMMILITDYGDGRSKCYRRCLMFLWSLLVVLATMVILNLTRLFLVFKVFDDDEYVGGNLVVLLVSMMMLVTVVTMITLNLTVLFLPFQGQFLQWNAARVQISMISYL